MIEHASGTHALTPSTIKVDPYHWAGYAVLWNALTTAGWLFASDTQLGIASGEIRSIPLLYQFHTEDSKVYTAEVGAVSHFMSNEVGLKCRVKLDKLERQKSKKLLTLESLQQWRGDMVVAHTSLLGQLVKQMPSRPMYMYPAALTGLVKMVPDSDPPVLFNYPVMAFFMTEANPYQTLESIKQAGEILQ